MTRREKLERRAETRRQWAASRSAKSDAAYARVKTISDGIPMGQPILVGHHSERGHRRDIARIDAGLAASFDHAKMADEHASKAEGIERALAGAIYSDDVDAVEQLRARIAVLEAERDRYKAYNASCKRGTGDESLLDERQRENLESVRRHCPYQLGKRGELTYTNLSANIRRNRERLEQLERAAVIVAAGGKGRGRPMLSRFASDCAECGERIEKGAEIVYYRMTREAVHSHCVKEA